MCEKKSWEKPFPANLNNGNFAYIDFTYCDRTYQHYGLVRKLLRESHLEHPEKHICFHRFTGPGLQKFYHRKPLNEKLLPK